MDKFKKVAKAPVNFVSKHRVAIAIIGTAAICTTISRSALQDANAFIESKGLMEEYGNFTGK
jgi:hypothetical protein